MIGGAGLVSVGVPWMPTETRFGCDGMADPFPPQRGRERWLQPITNTDTCQLPCLQESHEFAFHCYIEYKLITFLQYCSYSQIVEGPVMATVR